MTGQSSRQSSRRRTDTNARPLRGLIFDMDGVLIDSHTAHLDAWRRFLQTLGHDVAEPDLDFILDGRKRGEILRHFLGNCPDTELEEYGRRKESIFRQMQIKVAPLPGAVALVRQLHSNGIALVLATSASRGRARATLAELGLLHCFQSVVAGEDVALGKPDSAVYRLARERIGMDSEEMLAVEDAISGILAAVGAGLRCIGVASHESPEKLRAAGAVHVVRDFEGVSANDLQGILQGYPAAVVRAASAGSAMH